MPLSLRDIYSLCLKLIMPVMVQFQLHLTKNYKRQNKKLRRSLRNFMTHPLSSGNMVSFGKRYSMLTSIASPLRALRTILQKAYTVSWSLHRMIFAPGTLIEDTTFTWKIPIMHCSSSLM